MDQRHHILRLRFPLSKKRGTNAVTVANEIINKSNELKAAIIPSGMEMKITRRLWRNSPGQGQQPAGLIVLCTS